MTPRETCLTELQQSTEAALRSELWLHGFEPSEAISKDILVNMLLAIYFEG